MVPLPTEWLPHSLDARTVLDRLASRPEGLASAEAARRLSLHGPNRLPDPPRESALRRLLKQFQDVLIYVLLGSAAVTALMAHWVDTGVIVGVVLLNGVIGFLQEGRAQKALDGLRRMLSPLAHVLRDGAWAEIPAAELVPGDIVRLRSGDRVPADLRFLEVASLRIEESALTGESVPSSKAVAAVDPAAGVGDRQCMAFSGTLVTAGRGLGVVTATGPATELGRINRLLAEVQSLATPLSRQMDAFGRLLSGIVLALALLMGLVGWLLHGQPLAELFMAAIGFAVAAIPEGLPAVLTITLAIGVQRMARRRVITRRLTAVDTLGSVTVICTDKTGTLTRNEMTARQLVTPAGHYRVDGAGYAPEGRVVDAQDRPAVAASHPDLLDLAQVAALCNDAHLAQDDAGQWTVVGEPTEGALAVLARKLGFDPAGHQRLDVVPFESDHKYMATLQQLPGGPRILLKGAPDRLLARCSAQTDGAGATAPLDLDRWHRHMEELGSQGMRVLALARKDLPGGTTSLERGQLESGLVFLGLAGIIDPPRPEAVEAIRACQQAGIRVKVITGDHADTAQAIAREMGIPGRGITGAELDRASDEELRTLAEDYDVFARTSPEHKLRLVQALQANGRVVAMTGDGINDAPALKRADVGVAMGLGGTDAAKEAADIVLADNNFASIAVAVREGRTIHDNRRKAILFALPTNGAESLVIFVAVVLGLTLPLTPVQILWVNMVTAVTLALALAFEAPEPGVMRRPPRRPDAPLLSAAFLWRVAFASLLIGTATILAFLHVKDGGTDLPLARTIALNTLVVSQIFFLFNSRQLHGSSLRPASLWGNATVWVSVLALATLQLTYVYAPFMHAWFGSTAMAPRHWLVPLATGVGVFLLVELEKAVARRLGLIDAEGA